MSNTDTNEVIDMGNNESMARGVFPNADGTYTALTYTQSKTFKTRAGANRWYIRRHRNSSAAGLAAAIALVGAK